MAITLLSYTRHKGGAKASLDYYAHRPNRDGERANRDLFGRDGALTKRHGYLMIDRASVDTVFLRIALSPDPNLEDAEKDLNLRTLTEQTIARLQQRVKQKHLQYIATEHTDQTEIRHVHIIALVRSLHLTNSQLTPEDLAAVKAGATADVLALREELDEEKGISRRRQARQQAPAPPREPPEALAEAPPPRTTTHNDRLSVRRHPARLERSPGGGRRPAPACPQCGSTGEMVRRGRFRECANCGLAVRRGFVLEILQSPGLELALEEVGGI